MGKENKVLKLNAKPHTRFGITSLIVGILSLALGISAIILASTSNSITDQQAIRIGLLEWCSFMFNLIGITFGVIAEFRIDREKIFAHFALGLHVVLFVFHVVVVVVGF